MLCLSAVLNYILFGCPLLLPAFVVTDPGSTAPVCSSLQLITFPCVMAVLIQLPPFHLNNVFFFSVKPIDSGGPF